MADIFTKPDVAKLLRNKHVIFLGDSNTRPLYKDIVCLLKHNGLISNADLRRKLEPSFMGDRLLRGDKLTRGRDYEEVRQFKHKDIHLEFYFITRCYNKYIEDIISRAKGKKAPDVIVMNSVLWDITRWGPLGVERYKDNLMRIMKLFKKHLSPDTLFVWNTAPPISKNCYGGTLIKQIDFLKHTLRFEVMEANMLARDVVGVHGFHVLDMHYYLRMHMLKRAGDGIHWQPAAVRYMTNLLLTHIALSFEEQLPGNYSGPLLREMVDQMRLPAEGACREVALPAVPASLLEEVAPPPLQMVLSPFRSPFRQPPATSARGRRPHLVRRWNRLHDKENVSPCLVKPKLKTQQVQSEQPPWSTSVPSTHDTTTPRLEVTGSVLKPLNTVLPTATMAVVKSCASQAREGKENCTELTEGRRHHRAWSRLESTARAVETVTLERMAMDSAALAWRDSYLTSAVHSVVHVPTPSSRSRRRPMPY